MKRQHNQHHLDDQLMDARKQLAVPHPDSHAVRLSSIGRNPRCSTPNLSTSLRSSSHTLRTLRRARMRPVAAHQRIVRGGTPRYLATSFTSSQVPFDTTT